jgi:large subunit ribosomal protein L29
MAAKMKELRGMSDEQLGLTLKDTEKHLFQLRFQSATDRLETPSEIRKAKREVARIKTVQRERELVKLSDLLPEQLASRITTLETKVEEGRPGKRVAFRQAKRLKRFHAAKAPAAPKPATTGATGKPAAPAATTATAATKPATGKTGTPAPAPAAAQKGSGK